VLLGSVDVSPLEVAQLYNAFANGGFSTPLRAVRSVVNSDGQPLKSFSLEVTPVASPESIYQVNRMLVEVMEHGSGQAARAQIPRDIVVAGKTGTSSDYRDSWFAGFSGNYLAVVWIGYDDNTPTGLTGSSGSLPVWSRLMANIGTTSWNAPLPEGLQEAWIEFPTGLGARPDCGDQPIAIAVPQGTQLPMRSGCEVGVFGEIGEKAKEWWRGIIRQ
jgi:penicillin-binding protein 1B